MIEKEERLYINRTEKFLAKLSELWIADSVPFEARFCRSDDPVPFEKRGAGGDGWKPIKEGDQWGTEWDSAWFELKAKVPAAWEGRALTAHLDFNGEALIFDEEGRALQGLSDGSVFWANYSRAFRPLTDSCRGGEEISLVIEASASNLFGINKEDDPKRDAPKRHGNYQGRVNHMKLCLFNREYYDLYCDFITLARLLKGLPPQSVRRARILYALNKAMDAHHGPDTVKTCRDLIKPVLDASASGSDLKAVSVGHAHIDTAWLWPMRETRRKCGRTFSSQLDLMERYPDYVFGASQPQLYEFTKEDYPDLYERIKERVAQGRWELQGGMWVEADCNVISGESMVRQFLHGKNFYMDEFGRDVKNLWIPDVFGYSAAMPQIMKKCGVDYFLTQKISWSQFNHFPHHTFMWEGIDGSRVLTHFPPEDTYNSDLDAGSLRGASQRFEEKGFLDEFMVLFGIGDGGGGPRPEQIEAGIRQKNLEGTPRVQFGRADDFFTRLEKRQNELARWKGELYLELHRGTLTTQAKVKRYNRLLENRLRKLEFLASCGGSDSYPRKALDRHWKDMLTLHFHDIIPGSSINWVYRDTHKTYERILADLDRLEKGYFDGNEDSLTLVNALSHCYDEPVRLPESWKGCAVTDKEGKAVPVQILGDDAYAKLPLKAMETITLSRGAPAEEGVVQSTLILENDLVRYELNDQAQVISCFDKELKREMLAGPANVLTLYEDVPCNWDAWDIDIYYENQAIENARSAGKPDYLSRGPVGQGVAFSLVLGDSTLKQKITLAEGSKMLRFDTWADWKELHKMLRVAFPVDVRAEQATFDIQYGTVKRNTHRNTSWDMAKFEVAGHKFADLSEEQYGAALLNDSKYGYKVLDNVLDLNLLRSPNNPDPDADYGEHDFTYAFLPHSGRLEDSPVYQKGAVLNMPPLTGLGAPLRALELPCRFDSRDISLEVVKMAEKEDDLILRLVELRGRNSTGVLELKGGSLQETDMMEWETLGERIEGKKAELAFKPFEIRTFRLCRP